MNFNLNKKFLDYDNFIEEFFGNPPGEKRTIIIDLETDTITELFEKLVTLFKDGLVYFYSESDKKVSIETLTQKELDHINKYLNSVGINCNFKKVSIKNLEKYENFIIGNGNKSISYMVEEGENNDIYDKCELIDVLDYKYVMSNLLEDRRFRLRKGNYVYIIWFTLLE
jgi:hypothetical protein